MSTKLGLCTHCHTNDVSTRVFVVNSEATVCYCPHCMKQLQPREAIANYELYLKSLVSSANKVLYGVKDYARAYETYADVLEFDPNCNEARYGRLLSLLYMSTVRKDRFNDFLMILNNDYENHFCKTDDPRAFLLFLNKCSIGFDEYEYFILKKLTTHSYFYDLDCLKLFFLRTSRMLEARKRLLELYEEGMEKLEFVSSEIERYHQDIIYDVSKSEKALAKHYYVAEGLAYSFAGFSEDGRVMAGRGEEKAKKITVRLNKASLDEDGNGGKVIGDKIYPDNIAIYKASKVTPPLFIILMIAAVACIVTGILLKEKGLLGSLCIAGASLFATSIVLMIIHIAFSVKLKSYRHLIK